jgi:hypothetical protein
MKMHRVATTLLSMAMSGVVPPLAKAQSSSGAGASSSSTNQSSTPSHTQPGTTYTRPTHEQQFKHYLFDALGPYAIVTAAVAAGISQASTGSMDMGQALHQNGVGVRAHTFSGSRATMESISQRILLATY